MRIADIPKQALITLIRAYQQFVSPLLPCACRYVPTCSEYAIEAIDRHGIGGGAARAGWRLLRCHPFARGGFDPVPLADRQARRDSFKRAPEESPTVALWDRGRSARLQCGVPAGQNHSTAHSCITH